MTAPKRIQLQRTKGWRKPEGAVVVARPTKWGNPFAIDGDERHTRADCVRDYRLWLAHSPDGDRVARAAAAEIRGKDLCCWCPLDQPCHADVLLEIANR